MNLLAIEQSALNSSSALLRDCEVISSKSWNHQENSSENLFTVIPDLLSSGGITLRDIDAYAVGLGPGSFSGLRISLSAANTLALPEKKKVVGIPSAHALAMAVLEEFGVETVAVIGDARRKMLWAGVFAINNGVVTPVMPLELVTLQDLASKISGADMAVSPDWDRIGEHLENMALPTKLLQESRTPAAGILGRLAFHNLQSCAAALPLAPLYMHPPVSPRK